jgi:type VI secretion system protein ImpH
MAAESGTPAAGVARDLFARPYAFDFFQAVRVMEALRPAAAPAGEGSRPADEAVRFRATPALGFAPSDVASVVPGENGGPPEMTVAFLGLAGAGGPLPRPFSEWVLRQARAGDTGPRDFLDLFHHRLVALMYRARARNRVSLARAPADETAPGRWLFALMGLGTPGLRDRQPVPDRALLGYAALFAGEVRSAAGLECVLSSHFGVRARVVPFKGGWVDIEPDDWTRIGATGQNRGLGTDAVLGRRAWDPHAAFEVELGPLSLGEYVRFLPDGGGWASLCALVRLWSAAGPAFTVRLRLRSAEVPPARLGTRAGARLGWTSWLRTRPRGPDDAEVRLDPARHGGE